MKLIIRMNAYDLMHDANLLHLDNEEICQT